jgi:hypothetical protein
MRKLVAVLASVVVAFTVTAVAQASTFVPGSSTISISFGGIDTGRILALPGTEGMVSLTDDGSGGHVIALSSGVWNTVNFSAGTSIYTGVPLISNILVTPGNQAGTLASGYSFTNFVGDGSVVGPYLGGQAQLSGQLALSILKGVIMVTFPLTGIGGEPGNTKTRTAVGVPLTVTGGPWATGPVPVTGITTNVVTFNGVSGAAITLRVTPSANFHTLSTGGGYMAVSGGLPLEYHTVTLEGDNQLLSESRDGTITLVAPIRIDTTAAISGRIPAAGWMDLTFVPEPGTMLLLVTGAVGLAVVGRRRLRR